jgi:LysM repeat protein
VAERVKAAQGMGAWPTCSRKAGQTSSAANKGSSHSSSHSGSSSSDDAPAKAKPKKKATSGSAASTGSTSGSSTADGDYTVKAGDTLSTIATDQHVAGGWAALRSANASLVTDPNMIFPGQKLSLS